MVETPHWTDEAILQCIKGATAERENALRYIVQQSNWREPVHHFILQNGGDAEIAKDIFQETLVIFDRNLRAGKFEGKSALSTYFMSIAKRRWWKLAGQRKVQEPFDPKLHDDQVESGEDILLSQEKKEFFAKTTGQIGKNCKEILRLRYLDYSYDEIAQKLQLSSSQMAKKEAYRCRLRLRELIEATPFLKNLFK